MLSKAVNIAQLVVQVSLCMKPASPQARSQMCAIQQQPADTTLFIITVIALAVYIQ